MGERGYLSPSEIDAIRKVASAVNDPVGAVLGALLAHIDALTAPADGEALGREAWIGRADVDKWGMPPERVVEHMRASFDDQPEEEQARYQRIGLRCYQRGVAVGIAKGEEERARLAEDLEGERRAYAVRAETERTEIDRLTAELVEARALREKSEGTFGRIAASLGLARQAPQWEIEAAVVEAKRDGALVERKACAEAIGVLRRGSDHRATERIVAFDEAIDAINDRGEGGAG